MSFETSITVENRIEIELWCGRDGTDALIREAHHAPGGRGTMTSLLSAIASKLGLLLSSADQADRATAYEAIRLLGIYDEPKIDSEV